MQNVEHTEVIDLQSNNYNSRARIIGCKYTISDILVVALDGESGMQLC